MFFNYKVEKIIKPFGRGNTRIDLVRDEESGRKYIRKRIRNLDTPLQRAMFDKETNALTKLRNCKNIVFQYDAKIGVINGVTEGWMHLEYIMGDILRKEAYQYHTIKQKLSIVKQLISATATIHAANIIHRDINPTNIMVTDAQITIIDFGICKILGETNRETTNRLATNLYAAPEIAYHSENASERSDMYSLGATILYLFTKKEPPLPHEIEREISITSGIDPQLKDILIKMTAVNPEDRYQDMYEVDIAMEPLYERYLKNDEIFRIQISSDMIERLRLANMVLKTTPLNELLRNEMPSNFSNCHAIYKKTNTDKEVIERFVFDGRHYSLICAYSEEHDCFVADDFSRLYDNKRIQHKQQYMETNGNFHFSTNSRFLVIKNNSFLLRNRIIDFSNDTLSSQNIDREYASKYGVWESYIDTIIAAKKERSYRFPYEKIEHVGNKINLFLEDSVPFDSEKLAEGDAFIFEHKPSKHKTEPVFLGTFASYNASAKIVSMEAPLKKSKVHPPQSGIAIKDYYSEIAQYKKQGYALSEFIHQEMPSVGNMKAIFSGLIEPDLFKYKISKYYDKKLDDSQRMAVDKAMHAQDIFLVQGPPGTGKTNVIVEIVRQMLKQHSSIATQYGKILIVAQAHAAVDKLLEDLDDYVKEVRAIRVGEAKNLSRLAKEKYGIDVLKQQWIYEVATNATRKLGQLLQEYRVEQSDFNEYYKAVETERLLTSTRQEVDTARIIIAAFCESYNLDPNGQILERLRIVQNWINQVGEKDDLIEYYVKNATIIVGTCAGFLGNGLQIYLQNTVFDCVIVDEAAKATIPELMLSLVKAKKAIMVGDHNQLPPVFEEDAFLDMDTRALNVEQLKEAGFKRLYEVLEHSRQKLTTQYRMHPTIGSMISLVFYEGDIQNGVSAQDRKVEINPFGKDAIVWISTSNSPVASRHERKSSNVSTSYANPYEVSIVMQILRKLDMTTSEKRYSVGVITPYRDQLELLRRDFDSILLKNISVDINTVDAFQGSQRDIIIYSTVRSINGSNIGFLKEEARLNVSLSRARSLLLIVGDMDCLYNAKGAKFKDIIDYMKENSSNCSIIDYHKELFQC